MHNIDYKELGDFWVWHTNGWSSHAFTEIRLMNIKDPVIYSHAQQLALEYPDIIVRKSSQFFIKTFNQLKIIMEYHGGVFHNSKICYSINPRFMANNDISGEYKCLKYIDKLFLDVEKVDHSALSDYERPLLEKYVDDVCDYLKRFELNKPCIVYSGNGIHILYKVHHSMIDDGRKAGYKSFIQLLESKLDNEVFHIDYMIDSTRTIAIPQSNNPKNNFLVHLSPKSILGQNYFRINKERIKHFKTEKMGNTIEGITIQKSLVWNILMRNAPSGDRHTILIFYLKMLIRDLNIPLDELKSLEREINGIYNGHERLNESGIKNKVRNFGTLINWVNDNKEWCKTNGIDPSKYSY